VILDEIEISLTEIPGHITACVFFCGCSFTCPYCHNPELREFGYSGTDTEDMVDRVVQKLGEAKEDGVTAAMFTGGDPLFSVSADSFITTLINALKADNFELELWVSTASLHKARKIAHNNLISGFMLDIKTLMDCACLAGPFHLIQRTSHLKSILTSESKIEIRTTVARSLHDSVVIVAMARQLADLGIKKWTIQGFRPKNCLNAAFNDMPQFTLKELQYFQSLAQDFIETVELRPNLMEKEGG